MNTVPRGFINACRRHGVLPTPLVFCVKIGRQEATLHRVIPSLDEANPVSVRLHEPLYAWEQRYRCSTSRFGSGQVEGSNCTPLGLHRIARKIGGGTVLGTVFKGRRPIGYTWRGMPKAMITTRILWLDGLEPGFNRGGSVDTFRRYIYIHGTGDEATIGRPASHGCVHLAANDLVPLFERVAVGTLVWIER